MTSHDLTAHDGPIARTPVWMNILMAPGNAVAGRVGRSTLRTTVSLVVWGLIVTDIGLAGALTANGTLGAALQSMSHRQEPRLSVALSSTNNGATATSAARPATAPTQVATAAPTATFTSEQVVARPTTPALAETPDRPPPRQRAARRPPAPTGPTIATDHRAARSMRGLY